MPSYTRSGLTLYELALTSWRMHAVINDAGRPMWRLAVAALRLPENCWTIRGQNTLMRCASVGRSDAVYKAAGKAGRSVHRTLTTSGDVLNVRRAEYQWIAVSLADVSIVF